MKNNCISTILLISLMFLYSCAKNEEPVIKVTANDLHSSVQKLTDVIVHDIFSPPVASRIYAYASIAAYEILALNDTAYISLAGQLNMLKPIDPPKEVISYEIAAVYAYQRVSRAFIFSEERMEMYTDEWIEKLKNNDVDEEVLENSLAYADEVAKHILEWSSGDNYKQTRTFQKYTISNDVSRWQPTPPAYMEAIEPHWSRIRPFAIDSANQFVPEKPSPFDMSPGSDFYKEVMEVYEVVKNADEEKIAIASFWDCNPYVMNVRGHVMFATKKITPGGHWLGVTKIASQLDSASLIKSAAAYALTSVVLADGFISCWDEKFRSNLIRPETVINRYIDEEWQPLLQTPPFPEYTSGHSVISSAAAVSLTSIFGDNFSYTDSTEMKYGLPSREFSSFYQASEEAAVSRLYGGIHYMPAIENGYVQGSTLGKYIVEKIKLKSE